MKQGIHPTNYRTVVIEDTSNGFKFITKSTAATDDTTKWEDGKEYPLVKVHISSSSHPFYTGEEKIMDIEGRVDRFKAKAEAASKKREAMAKKAQKQAKRAEEKAAEDEEDAPQKLGSTQSKTAPKKTDKPAKVEKPTPPADEKVEAKAPEAETKADDKTEKSA